MAAAAAVSRSNLRLLLATKRELGRLAEVQRLLEAHCAAAASQPPNLLHALLARIKAAGAYQLLLVERLLPTTAPLIEVQAPAGMAAVGPTLTAALMSVSGTDSLASDEQWEAAGRSELERLRERLGRQGEALPLAVVAEAAWRKRTALLWHSQHGSKPLQEQQAQLGALLQQLQDAGGPAEMLQWLEVQQPPAPVPRLEGVTIRLPAADGAGQLGSTAQEADKHATHTPALPALRRHALPAASAAPPVAQGQDISAAAAAPPLGPPVADPSPGNSCEFTLPTAANLPAALQQLGAAVRHALPLRERGAEAKRALCMGLLRRGLGASKRGYRQLCLGAGEAADIMRQAAEEDEDVARDYDVYAASGSSRLEGLLQDLSASSRLLSVAATRSGLPKRLLLRSDLLAAEHCQEAASGGDAGEGGKQAPSRSRSPSLYPNHRSSSRPGNSRSPSPRGGGLRQRPRSPARQRSRSRSLQRQSQRSRSPGPYGRGRSRSRSPRAASGHLSPAGGRRQSGLSPAQPHEEPPLVPVLIRHWQGMTEWRLTGSKVIVSGLPQAPGPEAAMRELLQRVQAAGGTVLYCRIRRGDERGDVAFLTLASARQAASAIERLQGSYITCHRLFLSPLEKHVNEQSRLNPGAAQEAQQRLARLVGGLR